jgi:hypothetical protein
VSLQEQSNSIASGLAASMNAANGQLDALNQEYIGYMEFAEKEGQRLYDLQIKQHEEQLFAITGGMDAELFIAQKQAEAVAIMKEIRDAINAFLGQLSAGAVTPGNGGGPAGGGGGGHDTGSGNVTINLNGNNIDTNMVVRAIEQNAAHVRRVLVIS